MMCLRRERTTTQHHIPRAIAALLVAAAALRVAFLPVEILATVLWAEIVHWIRTSWADIHGVCSIRWRPSTQTHRPSPKRRMSNNCLQFWHESIRASTALEIFKKSNNHIQLISIPSTSISLIIAIFL